MTLARRTPLKAKKGFGPPKTPMKRASLAALQESGLVQRASSFTSKPRKRMKVRAANNVGWVDVAQELWAAPENDHCCEVCGCFLGDEFSPTFYHHLLHRGSHRKQKRNPLNFGRVCPTHHTMAHEYGIEALAEDADEFRAGWQVLWARMLELRNAANNVKPQHDAM